MDEIGTVTTCGSSDDLSNGFHVLCAEPAPYRAEYRWLDDNRSGDDDPRDYVIPACRRHAHDARTNHSLKRIYSARDDHHGTDD